MDDDVPIEGSAQLPGQHLNQPQANYQEMVQRMKTYVKDCVKNGNLLEAEEAQIKIEQLKDEEYEVRRNELIMQNDKEQEDLISQRDE